jgi:hypothetical protein
MAPMSLRTALLTIGEPADPCLRWRDALAIKLDDLANPPFPPPSLSTEPSPSDVIDAFADEIAQLEAEVVAAQAQLDACVNSKPPSPRIRIPADFTGPRPASVREFIRACRQPRMAEWTNPERSFAENQDWTEELNGLVTDGHAWYASCNADDEREGLYKLSMSFEVERKLAHPLAPGKVHIGALVVRDDQLFVPMQGDVWGVWIVDKDLNDGKVFEAAERPHEDMFAWCDVNPHNGLIYTCNFTQPSWLYAYKRVGGQLKLAGKEHDIPLHHPTDGRMTTRVQGGCFTPNYKWLAVCDVDDDERLHCHSTLTGVFLDRRSLLADTDEGPWVRNELEGI